MCAMQYGCPAGGDLLGGQVCDGVVQCRESLLAPLRCLLVPHLVRGKQVAELLRSLQAPRVGRSDQLSGSGHAVRGSCGAGAAGMAAHGKGIGLRLRVILCVCLLLRCR